jgi:hypothetical protein
MAETNTIGMSDAAIDHEYAVLSQIRLNGGVKQRDIARVIGLSLGMTNAILKRLAAKGFVAMRRLNARNILYLVTPSGIDHLTRRGYRYVRRTVGHIVRYKDHLLEILLESRRGTPSRPGCDGVVLVGASDLDFLVEWCAGKAGLSFRRSPGPNRPLSGPEGARRVEFVIAGEGLVVRETATGNPGREERTPWWDLHIADLISGDLTSGASVPRRTVTGRRSAGPLRGAPRARARGKAPAK